MDGKNPAEAPEEYDVRSPISFIDDIALANIKIFHGKYDHVVPINQSLNFYAEMMRRHPESRTFLEVFDGKHQACLKNGFDWILSQCEKKNEVGLTG